MSGYPDSHLQRHAGRPRILRFLFLVIVPILILGWLAYLWSISGVLARTEKYDTGVVQAEGYVKRADGQDYKRHGHWVTYYPDGTKESEGNYHLGTKTGRWTYWDKKGKLEREEVHSQGRD